MRQSRRLFQGYSETNKTTQILSEEFKMTLKIRLPDLNAEWKWPRRMNPHTADIQEESSEWVTKFKAFTPEAQKAFDKCNFSKSIIPVSEQEFIHLHLPIRSFDWSLLSMAR